MNPLSATRKSKPSLSISTTCGSASAIRRTSSASAIASSRTPRVRNPRACATVVHMQTVFEAAGGEQGMLRLADAWHQRVLADEVVSHAFSHGFHAEHTERLAAYWAEALGGPSSYSSHYGDESLVVRMHSGEGEHDEMDARAIVCFDLALAD